MANVIIALLLASSVASASDALTFSFADSSGVIYRSDHLAEDVKKQSGVDAKPLLLLLETPSLQDRRFLEQEKVLTHVSAENLALLIIIACRGEEYKGGYHTDIPTAVRLSDGFKDFRIRLLDGKGVVHNVWNGVAKSSEIKRAVQQMRDAAF